MKAFTTIITLLCSFSAYSDWDFFTSNKIKDDEQVIFFPSEASQNSNQNSNDGTWLIRVHGWIFEPETLGEINTVLRKALGLPPDHDIEDKSLLQKRIHWFKVDNERGKHISIRLADQIFKLNRSGANGHFTGEIQVTEPFMQSLLKSTSDIKPISYQAVLDEKDTRSFQGHVLLVPKTGISIISDIDDTIKVSNVTDKKELLINTFMRPFKAAPGMPELYQQWQRDQSAIFHYVSASPWQLYPDLSDFMQVTGFPRGLFHMKTFRWKDSSFLNLFSDPVEYKMDIIESIIKRHPQRTFILVGDSGEKDPEVYGIIARQYPRQIERILIRKVGDNNGDARFNSAFNELSPGIWQTFTQTEEIKTDKKINKSSQPSFATSH